MLSTEDQVLQQRRSPRKTTKTPSKVKPAADADRSKATNWGRSWGCLAILLFCPLLVLYFWMSCTTFQCSLTAPIEFTLDNSVTKLIAEHFPRPTVQGFALYYGWLVFQAVLYTVLPGKVGYGQMTPAGHTLPYIVNGLLAWCVTHGLYLFASLYLGLFKPSLVADNWGGLFIAANTYGYFLTAFSYVKAHVFPSHAEDRKFSSSMVFDLFMGIEFNPRFGKWFDFKLFHNGRPGIVAWTLINMSFAFKQMEVEGYVTNSMILLNFLHAVYVLDFFYHEDWYLRTIDIAHDHFGFYLAWGDSVWLPWMYTLQSHFLLRHKLDLSLGYFSLTAAIGLTGYYIFRTVNNQKDLVRSTDGNCKIWGKPAEFIRTEFNTTDGKVHRSLLLTSGYWGISRHFNYVGDLLLSLAMCMTCGTGYLLPYFYIIYMTILLTIRIERDHHRCLAKYGEFWKEYIRRVPYKLVPFVY